MSVSMSKLIKEANEDEIKEFMFKYNGYFNEENISKLTKDQLLKLAKCLERYSEFKFPGV